MFKTPRGWLYSGDINLECGGRFIQRDGDRAYVVLVTPCSDFGGPDNLFHIEVGSVDLDLPLAKVEMHLETLGYDLLAGESETFIDVGTSVEGAPDLVAWDSDLGVILRVDAHLAYGGVGDRDAEVVVQIGPEEETYGGGAWNPAPDRILRGNAKLANYVSREFLGCGC